MYIYQIKSNSYGKIKSFLNNPYVSYSYDEKDTLEIKKAIERTSKLFFDDDVDFIYIQLRILVLSKTIKRQ